MCESVVISVVRMYFVRRYFLFICCRTWNRNFKYLVFLVLYVSRAPEMSLLLAISSCDVEAVSWLVLLIFCSHFMLTAVWLSLIYSDANLLYATILMRLVVQSMVYYVN